MVVVVISALQRHEPQVALAAQRDIDMLASHGSGQFSRVVQFLSVPKDLERHAAQVSDLVVDPDLSLEACASWRDQPSGLNVNLAVRMQSQTGGVSLTADRQGTTVELSGFTIAAVDFDGTPATGGCDLEPNAEALCFQALRESRVQPLPISDRSGPGMVNPIGIWSGGNDRTAWRGCRLPASCEKKTSAENQPV